jgi:hypothetical protein
VFRLLRYTQPGAYLRDPWNMMDGGVVVISLVALLADGQGVCE